MQGKQKRFEVAGRRQTTVDVVHLRASRKKRLRFLFLFIQKSKRSETRETEGKNCDELRALLRDQTIDGWETKSVWKLVTVSFARPARGVVSNGRFQADL